MPRHPRRRQQGFSLVELMIAMAIGLVVMGAVFAAYIAANSSNRHSRALAQMTEDATSALAVMRAQIAMAGYSRVLGLSTDGRTFRTALPGPYLFGCQGSEFSDTAASMPALAQPGEDTLACPTAADDDPDSIAITYEANEGNSMVGGAAPVGPLDCVGNKVQTVPASGVGPAAVPAYDLAYSRFYIDNSRLMCRGNPANGGQPLAENIQTLQIQYGVQAPPAPGEIDKQRVAYYTDAATVSTDNLWGRVAAVRVCVVMRSDDDNVMDEITEYTGCFPADYGDKVTPTDRRAYRAFTTTIVLNNRLPPDPPVAASSPPGGNP